MFRLFVIVLLFVACSESAEVPEAEATEVISPAGNQAEDDQNIIAPALLAKAGISLSKITKEAFEAIPYPNADLRTTKELCEQSKGYTADNWEGMNDCSWAVELDRIKAHQTLVSRNGNQLNLKSKGGIINLQHAPAASKDTTFYQFKNYIPATDYYLIEAITDGQCIRSKLINADNNNQFNIKGKLRLLEDGVHLIAYNLYSKKRANCLDKLALYHLGAEGLDKKWHLPLNNKHVAELKYRGNNELYLALRSVSTLPKAYNYLRLSWQ